MDFDKTSFSVDWFRPGDRCAARKRLSFPKSARISIDDLVSEQSSFPSFCFSPAGEVVATPRSFSFVDAPLERASGWPNSAPPSPPAPHDRDPYVMDDARHAHDVVTETEANADEPALPSPGLLSVANDCASCGVDMDISCLDTLDEQLLLSPVACFSEQCWAEAVHDEPAVAPLPAPPMMTMDRSMRSRTRSFKRDDERDHLLPSRTDYLGSFERTRPLAAKITLPLDTFPHARSPLLSDSHDTLPTLRDDKKPLAYILYTDPDGRPLHHGSFDAPRYPPKRGLTMTPSYDSLALPRLAPPPSGELRPSKSSQAIRAFSDACATLVRTRRRTPH